MNSRSVWSGTFAVLVGLGLLVLCLSLAAQQQTAPKFKLDPDWPKPLPNKWKMGGVTGLAVDKDDNVWGYDRPNDLTDIELEAELSPPIADCCVRPPSMIHIRRNFARLSKPARWQCRASASPNRGGRALNSSTFTAAGHCALRFGLAFTRTIPDGTLPIPPGAPMSSSPATAPIRHFRPA